MALEVVKDEAVAELKKAEKEARALGRAADRAALAENLPSILGILDKMLEQEYKKQDKAVDDGDAIGGEWATEAIIKAATLRQLKKRLMSAASI